MATKRGSPGAAVMSGVGGGVGRDLEGTTPQTAVGTMGVLPEEQVQGLLARIEDAMAHAIDLARRMPSDVKT